MSLRDDGDVHQNETSFVLAAIKLSNEINVFNEVVKIRNHVVVLIMNVAWVLVIGELPIVEGVSVGIVEEGLSVSDTFGKLHHWLSEVFWDVVHASSVGVIGSPSVMAWLKHVGAGQEGVVSEQCCVQSFVKWVHLFDLVHQVWQR